MPGPAAIRLARGCERRISGSWPSVCRDSANRHADDRVPSHNPVAFGQTRRNIHPGGTTGRGGRVDRCVVLVDAGYLLGAAASLLAGEPSRSLITVDHAAVVAGLRERAELDTSQPLLRIYWFD